MQRREFLKSSAALTILGSLSTEAKASPEETNQTGGREFYELRLYHLHRGPQREGLDRFYREAAIPAMNRAGVSKVGAFSLVGEPENPTLYVLLTHPSVESVATLTDRLLADPEYLKAGAEFLNAPATAPAYVRVESSLLAAFGMPRLKAPDFGAENKSSIFELRTYESPSKKANKKKIAMFERGEISIFERLGMQPVFFGETLIGTGLPNLTYMLTFPNETARTKGWGAFGKDAEWQKLKAVPGNTDAEIVSKIDRVILHPTAYSQI
jgi:hypothetical protein